MRITVTEIGVPTTVSKGKATWQEIPIKYNGNKGPQERKVRSFEQGVFAAFKSDIKPGDSVEVTVVKEGDYWQWKDAKVVEGGSNNQTAQGSTSGSTSGTKKVGDWETREERAARQRYIVRQSSITSAISLLNVNGNSPTVGEVLDTARKFEAFVFEDVVDTPKAAPKKKAKPQQDEEDEVV